MIFNGKEFSKKKLEELKEIVSSLPFVPEFSDVLVGDNGVSLRYVKMKRQISESIGIKFIEEFIPQNSDTNDVVSIIQKLASRKNMCGIIVQLPLPPELERQVILDAVPLHLDVDGLSTKYEDIFYQGEEVNLMPTVSAIWEIIQSINFDFNNKNVVVVGQGKLVGKPLSFLFTKNSIPHKIINSKTDEATRIEILKEADMVVSAVGIENLINSSMLKNGVSIIDAGTLEVDNKLKGDVNPEFIHEKASFLTPTPGGVGPVTVVMLMKNIVSTAINKLESNDYE